MTVPVAAVPSVENPIDVLLVGLGSIGSIYAWLLERVRDVLGVPFSFLDDHLVHEADVIVRQGSCDRRRALQL
jgi:hypothetical protein